jgi:hypothetical protein
LEVVQQYDHFTKKEKRAKEDSFGKYPIHYAAEKGFHGVIFLSFSQKNYLFFNNLNSFYIIFTYLTTI